MSKTTLVQSLKNAKQSLRFAKTQAAKLKVIPSHELTKTHVESAIDDAMSAVEEAEELLGEIKGKDPVQTRTPNAMKEIKMDIELVAKIVKGKPKGK